MALHFVVNKCLTGVTELQLLTLANFLKASKIQLPGLSKKSAILAGIIRSEFPDLTDEELLVYTQEFTDKKRDAASCVPRDIKTAGIQALSSQEQTYDFNREKKEIEQDNLTEKIQPKESKPKAEPRLELEATTERPAEPERCRSGCRSGCRVAPSGASRPSPSPSAAAPAAAWPSSGASRRSPSPIVAAGAPRPSPSPIAAAPAAAWPSSDTITEDRRSKPGPPGLMRAPARSLADHCPCRWAACTSRPSGRQAPCMHAACASIDLHVACAPTNLKDTAAPSAGRGPCIFLCCMACAGGHGVGVRW